MIAVEVAYFLQYHYTPYAKEQGIISAEQGIPAHRKFPHKLTINQATALSEFV